MEQKIEIIINQFDLDLIMNNQFDFSLKGLNFPLNTQLVKVLTPNFHSFIYVFIENNRVSLPINIRAFFKNFQLNDRIYLFFKAEINFDTISITEILFSLDCYFNDLKVDSQPIISNDLVQKIKNIIPSVYC